MEDLQSEEGGFLYRSSKKAGPYGGDWVLSACNLALLKSHSGYLDTHSRDETLAGPTLFVEWLVQYPGVNHIWTVFG
jgi:hypothetical protein